MAVPGPTTLLVFLAGSRRGTSLELAGDVIRIGVAAEMDVRLPSDTEPLPSAHHATLTRRGATYELEATPGSKVWVNGELVDRLVLASGDVLELGGDGAVLRYRLYPAGTRPQRSMGDVFSDCLECAERATETRLGQMAVVARQLPGELLTQTPPAFRAIVVVMTLLVAGLGFTTWFLARRTADLELRLAELTEGVAVSEMIERSEAAQLNTEQVTVLLSDLQASLDATTGRLDSLQGQIGALGRAIQFAARSTIFLQGSYGFRDPESGRMLRLVIGADGRPITGRDGEPTLTLSGIGPRLQALYTGTGFVASTSGLIFTNRHVALPWEFDESARALVDRGLEPVMVRFVGYLPGEALPFDVVLAGASADADVALLRGNLPAGSQPLILAERTVAPGDEVAVVGYPLGIRALMARAGTEFVEEVRLAGGGDFWAIAEGLAQRRLITPLATRGIVGQRTDDYVVYDAETTSGGSGGPVVRADGRVVAINSAVFPEFGGSNLGVPAERAASLLRTVESGLVGP